MHDVRRRTFLHHTAGSAAALASAVWPLAARAQTPVLLRVTAIPDEAPTELAARFAPLGKYLEARTGCSVVWTPVTDYAAAVETLVTRKVDLAWFGGFTYVQSAVRSGGKTLPLVQRAEDANFHSLFITATGSGIAGLADLKGRTFSFGAVSSTSGHLMPRSALLAAHIDPEHDFKRVAYSGAHDATIAAVAGGKVDAGAVNASVWAKFVDEQRVDTQAVKVFHTTPPFHDYNWTVHADMAPALRDKISRAFLELDPATPEGADILKLQRASRFVPTTAANYDAIRAAADNAGLL